MVLNGISFEKLSHTVATVSIRQYDGALIIKEYTKLSNGCRFVLGFFEHTPWLTNLDTISNDNLLVRVSGRFRTIDAPEKCYCDVLKEL